MESGKTEGRREERRKERGRAQVRNIRSGGEARQSRAQSLTLLTEVKRRLKNSDEWSAGNLMDVASRRQS